MEKQMKELHQRTPLFIGSTQMVEKAMEFMLKFEAVS
jgi:fructose-1,6-bisphosphatase